MIRLIQPSDNSALKHIIETVMPEYGASGEGFSIMDAEVQAMYEAYSKERCKYYVVEIDGEVLGGAGIGPLVGGDSHVCELKKMYFMPNLRGQGHAGKLMQLLLDDAKQLGYTHCYIETLEHMHEARKLYTKWGFKRIEQPMGSTGHTGCNYWMLREI
jgi:putative acetyltransferase